MAEPNQGKLTSMHFYAWKLGLKTGMYYLRTQAAVDAIKFTVDQQMLEKAADITAAPNLRAEQVLTPPPSPPRASPVGSAEEIEQCSRANRENCVMCGS